MGRNKKTDEAMIKNNISYINYLNRLKLIAISMFNWEGLDEIGGNVKFLETTLYEQGRAVFIKDDELGYMTLQGNPAGKLNVYNLPTKIMAYSHEYNKEYNLDECVYILNNELEQPTRTIVEDFAYKLYNIDRTIDININAQKTPVILQGTDQQRITLENLYNQYDGNMPFIFGDSTFNLENAMKVLDLKAAFISDKLTLQKHDIWNECLTYLGINNANTDKKERLITDEVNSNDELINYYLNCFYKPRKRACDEINKMFFNGEEKIKLSINTDLKDLLNLTINENFNEKGDDNE